MSMTRKGNISNRAISLSEESGTVLYVDLQIKNRYQGYNSAKTRNTAAIMSTMYDNTEPQPGQAQPLEFPDDDTLLFDTHGGRDSAPPPPYTEAGGSPPDPRADIPQDILDMPKQDLEEATHELDIAVTRIKVELREKEKRLKFMQRQLRYLNGEKNLEDQMREASTKVNAALASSYRSAKESQAAKKTAEEMQRLRQSETYHKIEEGSQKAYVATKEGLSKASESAMIWWNKTFNGPPASDGTTQQSSSVDAQ
eukprot:Clim_evm105s109 gene=Clim_evmTU105s109